jgi:hypothetical protein
MNKQRAKEEVKNNNTQSVYINFAQSNNYADDKPASCVNIISRTVAIEWLVCELFDL